MQPSADDNTEWDSFSTAPTLVEDAGDALVPGAAAASGQRVPEQPVKEYDLEPHGTMGADIYIRQNQQIMYMSSAHSFTRGPEIRLHAGDEASESPSAAAKFSTLSHRYKIQVRGESSEWIDVDADVTYSSNAWSLPASRDATRRSFEWKRTRGEYGGMRNGDRGLALVMKRNEQAPRCIAIFKGSSAGHRGGRLAWYEALPAADEQGAVVVLLAVIEKMRRRRRNKNMITTTNGGFGL